MFCACSKHSGTVDPIGNPGTRATKDALNIQKEQVLKENPSLDKYQSKMKERSLNVERMLKCGEKRISLCNKVRKSEFPKGKTNLMSIL